MKTYEQRTQSICQKVKAKRRNLLVTACAALCVVAVVCCVVILPLSTPVGTVDISKYQKSDYFSLIEKLSKKSPLFGGIVEVDKGNNGSASTVPGSDEASNTYRETTLNQVDGVIEGDLMKRSARHVFYLKSNVSKFYQSLSELPLRVMSVDGEQSQPVCTYNVAAEDGTTFTGSRSGEIYLSEDAKTLTVLTTCRNANGLLYTCVVSLDVSDVTNIVEKERIYVAGEYLTSRKVNGDILVVSRFCLRYFYGAENLGGIDFDKPQTFVPHWGRLDDFRYLPMSEIVLPDEISDCTYTTVVKLNEGSLEMASKLSFLSYAQQVAVSSEHIFITRPMRVSAEQYRLFDFGKEYEVANNNVTEIACVAYRDKLQNDGIVTVDGRVKDRYCIDEKDGILRVVTTTGRSFAWTNVSVTQPASVEQNASLFCIDVASAKIVGKVERFAPVGESVQSARFDGDVAYVCTAVRNTDPVFMFDLSDPTNITCKNTGTIPGYSINLLPFGDCLLGIGYGSRTDVLKVEAYRESQSEVESVDAFVKETCGYSSLNKAHFVDAERGLVGLLVADYNEVSNPTYYVLLRFDGTKFTVLLNKKVDCSLDNVRAFFDDGLYVVTDSQTQPILFWSFE